MLEPDTRIVVKTMVCPNGHRLKLAVVADTPNMIRMVKCPICGVKRIGLIGQLHSVDADKD